MVSLYSILRDEESIAYHIETEEIREYHAILRLLDQKRAKKFIH